MTTVGVIYEYVMAGLGVVFSVWFCYLIGRLIWECWKEHQLPEESRYRPVGLMKEPKP